MPDRYDVDYAAADFDADGIQTVRLASGGVTLAVDGTTDPTSVASAAAAVTSTAFANLLTWDARKAESVIAYIKNSHATASLDYQLVGALDSSGAASAIVCGPWALAALAETKVFRRSMPHLHYFLQQRSTASGSPASGIASGWALPTACNSRALANLPSIPASAASLATSIPVPPGAGTVLFLVPALTSGTHNFYWSVDGGTTKVVFNVNDLIDTGTLPLTTSTGSCRVKCQLPSVGGPNLVVGCYSSVVQTATVTVIFEA